MGYDQPGYRAGHGGFEVFGEPAAAAKPCEGALDHPPTCRRCARHLLTEAGLHRDKPHVIDVGALARYDRPMPTMAEYDVLLSGPCVGTA